MTIHFDALKQSVREGQSWTSMAPAGLSVGLLLSGGLDFRLADQPYRRFEGPLGFLFATDMERPVDHRAIGEQTMTCLYLHLPLATMGTGSAGGGLHGDTLHRLLDDRSGTNCRYWRSSASAAALGLDIQHCPFVGVARQFYVQAKGYEFLARAIDGLLDPAQRLRSSQPGLTASDVERLHAARDILTTEYTRPPSLDSLAHRVGLSVTRLTAGFRRLFGTSVVSFLQDHRLQVAHDGLTAGRMTVAQAAHAAGYQPSSFSALFRRRYGVTPSSLRRRHL